MRSEISRRDFLKMLAMLSLPFFGVGWPHLSGDGSNSLQSRQSPNILILLFDALSAQHMSLYGYNRETTPNLARFAERATVYHSNYASASFTSPGTASLFTGAYPWSHRAFHLHDAVDSAYEKKNIFSLMPGYYYKVAYTHNLLVASLLHQFRTDLNLWKKTRDLCLIDSEFSDQVFSNDYNVAFWSEWLLLRGGKNPPSSLFLSIADRGRRAISKRLLAREYAEVFPRGLPNLHSLFFTLEHAIDWIKDEVSSFSQPFLGYFHLLPPHEPYTARRDFVDIFKDGWKPVAKKPHFSSEGHSSQFLNQQRREYDEYLAYIDAEFGRLFDSLEQSGLLGNTYVVLTSDHGEMFERGIRGHVTLTLYEPVIRVPLIISRPGQRQREDVYTPTSCVDLLPTLLDIAGQALPDWCEGEILPAVGDQETHSNRAIFAVEAKSNPRQAPLAKGTVALVKDQYKLIHYFGYRDHESEYELYDLTNDPEELEDVYTSKKSTAGDLQDQLAQKLRQINQPYF